MGFYVMALRVVFVLCLCFCGVLSQLANGVGSRRCVSYPQLNCDFDETFCDWESWRLANVLDNYWYLTIDGNYEIGSMTSPTICAFDEPIGSYTLKFQYRFLCSIFNSTDLKLLVSKNGVTIWEEKSNTSTCTSDPQREWYYASVSVDLLTNFTIKVTLDRKSQSNPNRINLKSMQYVYTPSTTATAPPSNTTTVSKSTATSMTHSTTLPFTTTDQSPTPNATDVPVPYSDKPTSDGAVIGASVGVSIVVLIAVSAAVVVLWRRRMLCWDAAGNVKHNRRSQFFSHETHPETSAFGMRALASSRNNHHNHEQELQGNNHHSERSTGAGHYDCPSSSNATRQQRQGTAQKSNGVKHYDVPSGSAKNPNKLYRGDSVQQSVYPNGTGPNNTAENFNQISNARPASYAVVNKQKKKQTDESELYENVSKQTQNTMDTKSNSTDQNGHPVLPKKPEVAVKPMMRQASSDQPIRKPETERQPIRKGNSKIRGSSQGPILPRRPEAYNTQSADEREGENKQRLEKQEGVLNEQDSFYFVLDEEAGKMAAKETDEAEYALHSDYYSSADPPQEEGATCEISDYLAYYSVAEESDRGVAAPEESDPTYYSIADTPQEQGATPGTTYLEEPTYYGMADTPEEGGAASRAFEQPRAVIPKANHAATIQTSDQGSVYSLAKVVRENGSVSVNDVPGKEDYNTLNFDGQIGAAAVRGELDGGDGGGEAMYSHLNDGDEDDAYSHADRDGRKVEVIDENYSHINY